MNARLVAAIVRLHFRRVAADRSNLIWLFLMPMIFSVLMGMMMGSFGSGSKPAFVVYDAARNPESERFIAALEDTTAYRVVVADTTGSAARARALVDDKGYGAALYIPPGFGVAAAGTGEPLGFHYDPDRLSAQQAHTSLIEAVRRLEAEQAGIALAPDDFNRSGFDSLWAEPRLVLESRDLGRRSDMKLELTRGGQHVGPGYTLMFVMTFMLMSVKDLVQDRREGTLTRMRLGAGSSSGLAAGLFIGPLLVGVVQTAILLVLNSLALGIDYGDSPATLALLTILFAAVFSALALLLGTICRTPGQADGIGLSVSLLFSALGGLWWPLEVVPGFMQKVGLALPTGQAIRIYHDLIGRGYGLAESMGGLIYLLVAAVILLGLAITRFRRMTAA